MARAHSIHVVIYTAFPMHEPVAAFTVKHELETWLERQTTFDPKHLRVVRVKDGAPKP